MNIQILIAFFVSLIFSATCITTQIMSDYGITPFMLVFIRYFLSVIFIIPFIKKSELYKLNTKNSFNIVVMGLVGVSILLLFFSSLIYSSAITVSLVVATNPIIALLVTSLITSKVPNKMQMLSLISAFAGVSIIIIYNTSNSCGGNITVGLGELLALGSVFAQIIYALLANRLSNLFSPTFLIFGSSLAAVIVMLPFFVNINCVQLLSNLGINVLLLLLYIGLFDGVISAILYINTVRKFGAALSNFIIFSCMPIFTALLSILLLGVIPTIWHIIGGVLVVTSLYYGLKAY